MKVPVSAVTPGELVDSTEYLAQLRSRTAPAIRPQVDGQITQILVKPALQVYLGSAYVNDFDLGEHTYRVYVQADAGFRHQPENLRTLHVRSASGAIVPLDNLVRVHQGTAPQVITHFNLFRSAEINGSPAPGGSTSAAMQAMEQLTGSLPSGMTHEWAGLSLEQQRAGNQVAFIFALAVIVVFLVLAAQYESFALPLVILLAVPIAILGALALLVVRGLISDVFAQIGMVMLVGLASKNAILIVEFAQQLRAQGRTLIDAAVEAATIRLRPILMTSFAFIFGVLPLVFASGSGAGSRRSLGTTVLGGMIASTFLNLAFIPVLYVVIEGWRERRRHGGAEPARMRVIARPDSPVPFDEPPDEPPEAPDDTGP